METLTDLIKSLKIKSIQRGVATLSNGDTTITINDLDKDKAIVILNGSYTFTTGGTSGRTVGMGVYLSGITDNSIKLTSSNGGGILPNHRIFIRYPTKRGVLYV